MNRVSVAKSSKRDFSACMAMITGMSVTDIPTFYGEGGYSKVKEWLKPKGYTIDADVMCERELLYEEMGWSVAKFILTGALPCEDERYGSAVVMRGNKVWHDPCGREVEGEIPGAILRPYGDCGGFVAYNIYKDDYQHPF